MRLKISIPVTIDLSPEVLYEVERLVSRLDRIAAAVEVIAAKDRITGIGVDTGTPTDRPQHRGKPMSHHHKPKVTLSKKSQGGMQAAQPAGKGAVVVDFDIQDNEDATFTVFGRTAGGSKVDIASVATLTKVESDNPAVLTVDPPSGMTSAMHAVTAGSANVTVEATWNDGSIGPFSFGLPVTVKPGPVTGLVIDVGTPTVH